jgi:hypothetical protein
MKVGMARAESSGTSLISCAAWTGVDDATRAMGAALCATLPHAWHSPHRPTHRGELHPHSVQRYGLAELLAMPTT